MNKRWLWIAVGLAVVYFLWSSHTISIAAGASAGG